MHERTNPFSARPGAAPVRLVGRTAALAALDDIVRNLAGARSTMPAIVAAPAGGGVTAVLRATVERAGARGWAAASVSAHTADVRTVLARGMTEAVDRLEARRRTNTRLPRVRDAVAGFAGGSRSVAFDLLACLHALGSLMLDMDCGLIVCLDDVHALGRSAPELGAALAAAAGNAQPATVVLGGLPMPIADLQPLHLPPLAVEGIEELVVSATEPLGVSVQPSAVDRLAALSKGAPFLVQSFAHHAWNTAARSPLLAEHVDGGRASAQRDVIATWYEPRLARLDGEERQYLQVVAELGGDRVAASDVARRLGPQRGFAGSGLETAEVAALRDGLLRGGLLWTDDDVSLSFALPSFGSFLASTL